MRMPLKVQMEVEAGNLIFFDLEAPSQIPSVAEPFFMGLDAAIEMVPAMTPDDVRAGLEEASKAFWGARLS